MYAQTRVRPYYPKAKDWKDAKEEARKFAEKYCKEIGGKKVAACIKAYGWCWNVVIYI